jgi:hypothetical protein
VGEERTSEVPGTWFGDTDHVRVEYAHESLTMSSKVPLNMPEVTNVILEVPGPIALVREEVDRDASLLICRHHTADLALVTLLRPVGSVMQASSFPKRQCQGAHFHGRESAAPLRGVGCTALLASAHCTRERTFRLAR